MSDQTTTNEPNQDGDPTGAATSGADGKFEAITSQEELNRIIGERVKRAKPADYDEVKAKAAKLDEIEQASKSEQQKLEERLEAAEQSAVEARAEALRFRVATKFGLGDEDTELFLTGSDEETLTKQAQRLAERNAQQPKPGPHVSREGGNGTALNGDPLLETLQSKLGLG